jgi:hypothetical protein
MSRRRRDNADAPWAISVFVALLFLNQLVASGDFVEAGIQFLPSSVALELVGAIVVLGALALLGMRRGGFVLWLFSLAFLAAFVLRSVALAIPWFFGRDLNVAVDIRFVPVFAKILAESTPTWEFVLLIAGAALLILAALTIVRLAFGTVFRALAAGRPGLLLPGFAALIALWATMPGAPSAPDPRPLLSADAALVVQRNVNNVLQAEGIRGEHRSRIEAAQGQLPAHSDFAELRGKHVVLIFAESYGRITASDPDFARVVEPARKSLADRLSAAGYASASSILISPITGGGSWMAHGTMLTGVKLAAQDAYEVMLVSKIRTLAHRFVEAGWRSLVVAPRIDQPWPEARLLGFEATRLQPDLGYSGPRYAWESLPDQWVLKHFAQSDLDGTPVFAEIILASSHTPFERVPPIVEDWASLDDKGEIYRGLPVREFPVRAGRVFEQDEAYKAAIAYVLESIGRFAEHVADKDALFIVLGDHQPPLTTARRTSDFGVPIHVFSRDAAAIERFVRRGYVPGIAVPLEGGAPMENFLGGFLTDFSSPQ